MSELYEWFYQMVLGSDQRDGDFPRRQGIDRALTEVWCFFPTPLLQAHLDEEEAEHEPRLRDTPEDISLDAAVNTIAFHPTRDIIVAGDVDGDVYA